MREIMIAKHNAIVTPEDTTFHLGDFCMSKDPENAKRIIERLNGNHYFLKGSHDEWLPPEHPERYMFSYNSYFIVLDHYQMDHWPRSHHGSLHFFGHQHGRSKSENIKGNKMEVFCGDFDYAPVELDVINKIISKPDYFRGMNFSKQWLFWLYQMLDIKIKEQIDNQRRYEWLMRQRQLGYKEF